VRAVLLAMLLLLSCRREGTTAADAEKVVRETLDEVRAKRVVHVQVRLDGGAMPTPDELKVRNAIEQRIEDEHVGRVVSSEASPGHYDIAVEVDSTVEAVPRIRSILTDAQVIERTTVRVSEPST